MVIALVFPNFNLISRATSPCTAPNPPFAIQMTTILSKLNNLFHRRRRTSSAASVDFNPQALRCETPEELIAKHKHSADCRHIRFNEKVTQIPATSPRRHHSDSVASYNRAPATVPRLTRSQSVRTRSRSEPTFYVIERRHVKSALHKTSSVDVPEAPVTKKRSSSQVIRVDPGSRTVVHISKATPRRCRDYYLI
uniref:Uncharacterized protein n=1 Tax=Steinernema glaseri TaxID=37863 RepID=A0A1I7ZBN8_9BILA